MAVPGESSFPIVVYTHPTEFCVHALDKVNSGEVSLSDLNFVRILAKKHPTGNEDGDLFSMVIARIEIAIALQNGDEDAKEELRERYPDTYKEMYRIYGFDEFAQTHNYRRITRQKLLSFIRYTSKSGRTFLRNCSHCNKPVGNVNGKETLYICNGCYSPFHRSCLQERLRKGKCCDTCD